MHYVVMVVKHGDKTYLTQPSHLLPHHLSCTQEELLTSLHAQLMRWLCDARISTLCTYAEHDTTFISVLIIIKATQHGTLQ